MTILRLILGACVVAVSLIAGGDILPERTAAASPPQAVIIVHGWRDNCSSFAALRQEIASRVFNDANSKKVLCFQYKSQEVGGRGGAKELAKFVDFVKTNTPATQVDIVAHSFGGLVSRWYIERLGGAPNVRRLIMLGTPNRGMYLAVVRAFLNAIRQQNPNTDRDKAARDMNPIGPFLRRLNNNAPVGGNYQVIAGAGMQSMVFDDWLFPNDCIVSTLSAKGPGFATKVFKKFIGDPALPALKHSLGARFLCLANLLDEHLLENQQSFDAVVDALTADNLPIARPQTPSTITTLNDTTIDSNPLLFSREGQANGTSQTFSFTTGDGTIAFQLFRLSSSSSIQLSIKRNGMDYGPPTSTGSILSNLSVNVWDLGYLPAGLWEMTLTGTSGEYQVAATTDSYPRLKAYEANETYSAGSVVPLRADLVYDFCLAGESDVYGFYCTDVGSAPAGGGSAYAEVTDPFGSTSSSPLFFNGSYFGGSFSAPISGTYAIRFIADYFGQRREALHAVDVISFDSDGDTLTDAAELHDLGTDPFRADTDFDTLTDDAEINVHLTLPYLADSDDDGCSDKEELGTNIDLGGTRDPLWTYDFFDVPTPATAGVLTTASTRSKQVSLSDVLTVLSYSGSTVSTPKYQQDNNKDGIQDGLQLDRRPAADSLSLGHLAGPPSGAISLADALIALGQVGDNCSAAP